MPAHSSVAKVMQGTAFRRLATKAGEKSGLVFASVKLIPLGLIVEVSCHEINKAHSSIEAIDTQGAKHDRSKTQ